MLDALRQDRFTRWVFAAACLFILIQSQWQTTGHHDRARFATAQNLVEKGTWSIEGSRYDTIDKVMHEGRLYASKPPMMPAIMAVVYYGIHKATGRTFDNNEWLVVKLLALLCIGVPFLIFVLAWASFLRAFTEDTWTYRYCLVAGAFGHYAAGYAVIVNNHTLATVALAGAVYNAVLVAHDKRPNTHTHLAWAGLFAGLAPTFEFPAAAASVGLTLYLLHRVGLANLLRTFAPAALLPLALHFALNLAVTDGSLLPFYIIGDYHYPGSYWNFPQSFDTLDEPKTFYTFNILFGHHGIFSCTPIFLLSLWGLIDGLVRSGRARFWRLSWVLAGTLTIVLPYFIFKTANYGGGAQGFRWLFWLTPMWLVLLIPAVERLRSGWAWAMATALLTLSIFNALFVAQSPWGQSTVHLLFNWSGIIDY